MLKAILFDLDDTLLDCSLDTFFPAYFSALTSYTAHLVSPQRMMTELRRAMKAMDANDGTGPTNEETFDALFYSAVGYEPKQLRPVFERFYREEFRKLEPLTRTRAAARPLMEWAFERGMQVVVATNPFFPRLAVHQRLEWADVPVDEFGYDLVTTYEIMHATKAHPSYYREILELLGRRPAECLMVGDYWDWDITPPVSLGMQAYWISPEADTPASGEVALLGHGTLDDLLELALAEGLVRQARGTSDLPGP